MGVLLPKRLLGHLVEVICHGIRLFFMISIDLGPLQHAFSTVLEGSKTSTAGSGSGSSSAWWA